MENNLLPSGWADATLQELCNMVYGKGLLTKFLTEEGYPVFGANGIIGKYSSFIYKEPQIIISCRGAASGVIHKTVPNSFVTSNSIVLQLNSKEIDLDYFKYSLLSVDRTKIVTGSAQPQITIENLNDLSIPIAPLPEQQRIVAKLDLLFQKLESNKQRLEKIPTILKRFRQSVLAAAVSGKLTEDWREENKISDAWEETKLKSITIKITDGDHQAPPKSTFGVPFIVISNISDGKLNLEEVKKFVPNEYYESLQEYRKPVKDDILYTVTGSIGIPLLVETDKPFCFQRHIGLIRPDQTKASPKFLFFYLQSREIYEQALECATGIAQLTIPLTGIREFNIKYPLPKEQKEIVKRVEQLFAFADKIETRYTKAKTMLDKLPQSILAKAFRGELVPQNPNDEPASVLLERIKKEKEKMNVEKKRKNKIEKI